MLARSAFDSSSYCTVVCLLDDLVPSHLLFESLFWRLWSRSYSVEADRLASRTTSMLIKPMTDDVEIQPFRRLPPY